MTACQNIVDMQATLQSHRRKANSGAPPAIEMQPVAYIYIIRVCWGGRVFQQKVCGLLTRLQLHSLAITNCVKTNVSVVHIHTHTHAHRHTRIHTHTPEIK